MSDRLLNLVTAATAALALMMLVTGVVCGLSLGAVLDRRAAAVEVAP